MSGQVHHVTIKAQFDADGTELTPDVKFECRGDDAAKCHQYPDPFTSHQTCWMEDWFEAGAHSYTGEDADDMCGDWGLPAGMNRSGLITACFADDYVEWEFVA